MTAVAVGKQSRHSLYPHDPLGQRLCETFSYFWQTLVGINESDPQWETITKYPLRPRVLWQWWKDSTKLVGVRFGNQTLYGLIDIDLLSRYHPAQDPKALSTIRLALETIGIYRTVLIRSSFSGGLHLYIPLPYTVPTFGLASALKQCLESQGFSLDPGQLEIYPNTKSYALSGEFVEYNGHRLPMQPRSGAVLLDDDCSPLSQDLGRFFTAWDWAAQGQSLEEVHEAISVARSNGNKRRRRRMSIIEDWREDLQTEINEGWTGFGQTNHLLKTIACYGVVFEGIKGEKLAEFVHTTAMAAHGYEEFCRHQHEIKQRACVWARSAEGYYWSLGDTPKRESGKVSNKIVPFNLSRSHDAQQRIQEIVDSLEKKGEFPKTATARVKAIEAQGISTRTLYKYKSLWHPFYYSTPDAECKTPLTPKVSADLRSNLEKRQESLKGSEDKEFYTSESIMKCKGFKLDFLPLNFNFSGVLLERPKAQSFELGRVFQPIACKPPKVFLFSLSEIKGFSSATSPISLLPGDIETLRLQL
ncbi:MAG: hypothetical protein KME10_24205 [Plectolyngbya sp. WJT66-NPBG17]|nr:hypothetical protein [Plectolyngbya sp. WJT66-NPBG17]